MNLVAKLILPHPPTPTHSPPLPPPPPQVMNLVAKLIILLADNLLPTVEKVQALIICLCMVFQLYTNLRWVSRGGGRGRE